MNRRRIPLGALQEREFRLFFTGQLVSLLGDAVTPFALVWAVLDLTGSARDLGLVLAAKVAPLVVFLLVGGVFADRLPRRGVMLTADVARMVVQAATAALLLSHTARIWELIVLQAFAGIGTAFFNPASTGLTPMTVSAGRLQEANALRGISMASMQFAGPALAGILIVTVGPGYALAIDATSFGVSAFYLARLHLPPHVSLPPQSFARDLLDGWHEFVARTWVWLIVVSVSLANMMDSVWLVLAAVWVKNGHGGAGAWTVILVVSAVGALSAGATALRLKPQRPLLLASIVVIPSVSPLIVLALKLPWETFAVAALVTGFGGMLFNTLWETTLQQHIPPASLSRVSAYDWFGSLLCDPLGLALAGVVAAGIGMSRTLWIAAAVDLAAVAAMLAAPSVRDLQRLDKPQLEQSAQSGTD
ncbi:MAG TPA: MFS transporter [Streptosporangiaceae bacterium]|nr:MFS transporter [Streptosporangiaceae bacterium]